VLLNWPTSRPVQRNSTMSGKPDCCERNRKVNETIRIFSSAI
jgi:hypothetical protein